MLLPRLQALISVLIVMCLLITITGCSSQQVAKQPPLSTKVKVMQVIRRNTPITYEFVGQIIAENEVLLKARVSGNIVSKMVNGGDAISKGQPLFEIDRRQYEAALLRSQALLAQSEAALSNSRLDVARYQTLAEEKAIAGQILDNIVSAERQNSALVNSNKALVQQAKDDLQDTLISAPLSGRIDIKDLSIGSFVQAGQTVLATVSSVDPIYVQFSMSENEYLRFNQSAQEVSPTQWGNNLKLVLSDGSEYPFTGFIDQIDRGLAQDTATLTMKAIFKNPNKLLIPGMFARVEAQGEIREGAMLIPQRAIQQVLGKTFVTVVGEGNKAEQRTVKEGPHIGNLCVIEEGLTSNDYVVVEGLAKCPPGTALDLEMIDLEQLLNAAKS